MMQTIDEGSAQPACVQRGLAMYAVGQGKPLLLMPYPHGFGRQPIAGEPLAHLLVELGQRVLAFDPPGAFHSTRPATVRMPEMLACAEETLDALDVKEPVTLVGHSMGGLCALAFALAQPERVKRLVLIGTLAGGSAIQRYGGMPWGNWLTPRERWQFMRWGIQLSWGLGGNLATHKQMLRLLIKASYVDPQYAPAMEITPSDAQQSAPVRDVWPRAVFQERLDYRSRLGEICVPTMVMVGLYDPQTPVGCSKELARGIRGAQLCVYAYSGHHPFVEERAVFARDLAEFFAICGRVN